MFLLKVHFKIQLQKNRRPDHSIRIVITVRIVVARSNRSHPFVTVRIVCPRSNAFNRSSTVTFIVGSPTFVETLQPSLKFQISTITLILSAGLPKHRVATNES